MHISANLDCIILTSFIPICEQCWARKGILSLAILVLKQNWHCLLCLHNTQFARLYFLLLERQRLFRLWVQLRLLSVIWFTLDTDRWKEFACAFRLQLLLMHGHRLIDELGRISWMHVQVRSCILDDRWRITNDFEQIVHWVIKLFVFFSYILLVDNHQLFASLIVQAKCVTIWRTGVVLQTFVLLTFA